MARITVPFSISRRYSRTEYADRGWAGGRIAAIRRICSSTARGQVAVSWRDQQIDQTELVSPRKKASRPKFGRDAGIAGLHPGGRGRMVRPFRA
jgi:hypothetical protein